MTSTERLAACGLCALGLWLAPVTARSQGRDDDPRRRQLILQAGALRDRGDHEGALERAREAAARRMTPSLRLFIAQEQRALGHPIEALRDARLCAEEFDADPSLAHRDEFLASCGAIVEDLSRRVGRLVVRVPADARGATVTVRATPLPRDAWGSPWEILPGRALVEASAPGRVDFSREVTVPAGGSVTVRVELPPLAASSGERSTGPGPTVVSSRGSGDGPWVLLGAAGGVFVLTGVFYGLRGGAIDDRDALCRGGALDCVVASASVAEEANAAQDRASTYNTLANVTLGLGAAALVGGVVWWIVGSTRSSGSNARASATVLFTPTVDGALVGVRGAL